MQVSSSITITAPEPSMEPALATESKSIGVSSWSAVSTGTEEPPGMTALHFLPSRMPPATSSIIRRKGNPIGSSYKPGRLTWPEMQNRRVPPLRSVPRSAYHSPPFRMMAGTELKVSTLLITVGQP